MSYAGGRVMVVPNRLELSPGVLPVVFVGHCPGRVDTTLLRREETIAEISQLGFSERARAIAEGTADKLYHLPVPIRSVVEFAAVFPSAGEKKARIHAPLGGTHAWLPEQVEDFFVNGGQKLWIVRVPECRSRAAAHLDAFGLNGDIRLRQPGSLRGIGVALTVDEAGIIALPDLERLRIPDLADPWEQKPEAPEPVFAPCAGSEVNAAHDDDGEPNSTEEDAEEQRVRLEELRYVGRLTALLRTHRPDVVVLHTLPLRYENRLAGPGVSWPAIDGLKHLRNGEDGHAMKRIQLLFPYLRGTDGTLRSPVGTIAGRQAASAAGRGVWYSIAGEDLFTSARPYPELNRQVVLMLRDEPGVGILRMADTGVQIDDERLMVPALHRDDYPQSSGYRSAEVMRFMGFLLRKLTELGDALVFKIDAGDPLPRLVLNQFFMSLFRLGALRGRLPEQAFRIHEKPPVDNALGFDIEVAPAFPVDRIEIKFVNLSGQWQATVGHV